MKKGIVENRNDYGVERQYGVVVLVLNSQCIDEVDSRAADAIKMRHIPLHSTYLEVVAKH